MPTQSIGNKLNPASTSYVPKSMPTQSIVKKMNPAITSYVPKSK